VVVNAEKEDNERKRKRKTLLSEKKEVCSKVFDKSDVIRDA
jgi:hypothetical protein